MKVIVALLKEIPTSIEAFKESVCDYKGYKDVRIEYGKLWHTKDNITKNKVNIVFPLCENSAHDEPQVLKAIAIIEYGYLISISPLNTVFTIFKGVQPKIDMGKLSLDRKAIKNPIKISY